MAGELADQAAQDDDALADARRWGFGDEELADLRAALGRQSGSKLWGMHFAAFRGLVAGGTQWRTRLVPGERGLLEQIVGLDYAALKVALDFSRIRLEPADWERLLVLERAAADAMNGLPAPLIEGTS